MALVVRSFEVLGRIYEGEGLNEVEARHNAGVKTVVDSLVKYLSNHLDDRIASKFPKGLYRQPLLSIRYEHRGKKLTVLDRTSVLVCRVCVKYAGQEYVGEGLNNHAAKFNACVLMAQEEMGRDSRRFRPSSPLAKKSTEKGAAWNFKFETYYDSTFCYSVEYKSKTFFGYGSTEEFAKEKAVLSALEYVTDYVPSDLIREERLGTDASNGFDVAKSHKKKKKKDKKGNLDNSAEHFEIECFGKTVELLIKAKHDSVVKSDKNVKNYDILAGIVMSRDYRDKLEVVALATGAKNFEQDFNVSEGHLINDFRAAILIRRVFLKFLYSQLDPHRPPDEGSIFTFRDEGIASLALKPDVEFHLYISYVPSVEEDICNKILRWNVLGIQGSLLSMIMKPIYLSSVIVGTDRKLDSLRKAIGKRLRKPLKGKLPPNFRVNVPDVVLLVENQYPKSIEEFSIAWNLGEESFELFTAETVQFDLNISGLTKRKFVEQFFEFFSIIAANMGSKFTDGITLSYDRLKKEALDYQTAKFGFLNAYEEWKGSKWNQRQTQSNDFSLSVYNPI